MRKLKYDLDRKSLETIYIVLIRPILEYADVLWDNCTQAEKQELEKIQLEAARIATGATKLVSIQKLSEDIGWEELYSRRKKHKLVLFYKMVNNIAPLYLSSLVPPLVQSVSHYSLRNANDLQSVNSRTTQYFISFLPSVIRDWNSLPCADRNVKTIDSFKRYLNQHRATVPKYFYTGNRKSQILHTRLRLGCSSLNYELFLKNIFESPLCSCGAVENTEHFFFRCTLYRAQRGELLRQVSEYCTVTLDILLKGNALLSIESNQDIFVAVQNYIASTNRF